MATNPNPPSALEFTLQVERFYAGLILVAAPNTAPGREPGLGGKLLYAGELDAKARALLVAANIAGAASLAVSADDGARKQAVRDGVVDFLVSSLDEALRILKNEIRKRSTVAACVAAPPQAPEVDFARQMLHRRAPRSPAAALGAPTGVRRLPQPGCAAGRRHPSRCKPGTPCLERGGRAGAMAAQTRRPRTQLLKSGLPQL